MQDTRAIPIREPKSALCRSSPARAGHKLLHGCRIGPLCKLRCVVGDLTAPIIGAALQMRVQTDFRIFGFRGFAILCFGGAALRAVVLLVNIFLQVRAYRKPRAQVMACRMCQPQKRHKKGPVKSAEATPVASGHQTLTPFRGSPAWIASNTHRRGQAMRRPGSSTISHHARRYERRTGFLLHSTFAASRLVRLLGQATPPATTADPMDFAERLSLWLGAFDAIGLHAAQQSVANARDAAAASPLKANALAEDLRRVRGALVSAIAQDPLFGDAPAFAPYHERHLQLQQRMEQLIGPLRDHVRQQVSRQSPRLRQLAALDAVFEHALAGREQALLPTVAARMKRRFEHWRATAAHASDAGAWERKFADDWRQVLLAEVDLRLEPVAGLIEAMASDMDQRF